MSDTWIGRIKQWMDRSGTSQGNLARALECTRGAVGHYLTGRRQPTLTQLERIADAMQVHPAWLLYGVGQGQVAEGRAAYHSIAHPADTLPLLGEEPGCRSERPVTNLDLKPLGERCYGIRIQAAIPGSYAGDIMIVDPAAAAHPGDEILVGFSDGGKMLQELVSESGGRIVFSDLIDRRIRKTALNSEILFMHRVIGILRKDCLSPRESMDEGLDSDSQKAADSSQAHRQNV